MPAADLTTLPDVKAWLGIGNTESDAILAPLVSAASRFVYGVINRPTILPRTITERYNGLGNLRLTLRTFPTTSIASLTIDGVSIPAAAAPGVGVCPNGYLLEQWDGTPPGGHQAVDLYGYAFGRGRQNVVITRADGYLVAGEAMTIPADPFKVTAAAPYGAWASDGGVTFANGVPLVPVAANPAEGQYVVAAGQYTFGGADTGKQVLASYGFIPSDLAQVCKELVAERYKYRDRIGQISKSLGGQETVSFSTKEMPDALRLMLRPYTAVVPV